MASKNDSYYDHDDEDEDDDEGDFVPGADDDDDLDDDLEEDNLDDDDANDDPLLQGTLYLDEENAIVFEDAHTSDQQDFRFVTEGKAPVSWTLQAPFLEKPILFAGVLKGQSLKLRFSVTRYDTSAPVDPLDERLLQIQQDLQPLYLIDPNSQLSATAKSGHDSDAEESKPSALDSKRPARAKICQEDTEDDAKPTSGKDIYVLHGEQTARDKDGTFRKIRGVFRVAQNASRIFLAAVLTHGSMGDIPASPTAPAAPVAAAVAVARKRTLEDDEDDGDVAVGYQELIDLHDDAGLSTEELRRRYYGGNSAGVSESNNKKAKPNAPEEDDDDDAYGF